MVQVDAGCRWHDILLLLRFRESGRPAPHISCSRWSQHVAGCALQQRTCFHPGLSAGHRSESGGRPISPIAVMALDGAGDAARCAGSFQHGHVVLPHWSTVRASSQAAIRPAGATTDDNTVALRHFEVSPQTDKVFLVKHRRAHLCHARKMPPIRQPSLIEGKPAVRLRRRTGFH